MKHSITIIILLISFSILLSLGYWQTKRLSWKNDIIAQLKTEYAKDPDQHSYSLKDLEEGKILYGSARGRFIYNKEILVGPKPLDGEIGYLVITPLKLTSKGYILVNRGWINQNDKDLTDSTHKQGLITINGIFRTPDWNRFTPNNSPENNIWTKLDIEQIANEKQINPTAPVMLYAETTSKPSDLLKMQTAKWLPRNKHRQYAIFWFTMAGALLLVAGLYWHQKKRNVS